MAQKFGWTLDYIASLTYSQRGAIFAVLEAQHQHEKRNAEKARAKNNARRKGKR